MGDIYGGDGASKAQGRRASQSRAQQFGVLRPAGVERLRDGVPPSGSPNTSGQRSKCTLQILATALGIAAHLGHEPIGAPELVHVQRAPVRGCAHDPLTRAAHINDDEFVRRKGGGG
jgi:hypothetical protein